MSSSTPGFTKRTPPGVKPMQRLTQPSAAPAARPAQRDRLSWHQFSAEPDRYAKMAYRRAGSSGLWLSSIGLGAWETFGGYVGPEQARGCIFHAFNLGVTHFDLANNYGTPVGRAEIMVGRVLREMPRQELIVATKAGFPMWPGPYGEGASRKALLASIDQSLQRLGLDHVDIFYSHKPDESTPLEETLRALDQIVRQGKALYLGLSNYSGAQLREAARLTRELNLAPISVTQVGYNLFRRDMERDVIVAARETGMGVVTYSALAQGMLSAKYLDGIPEGSRLSRSENAEKREQVATRRDALRRLNEVAKARGQTLAQMALAWTLRYAEVTSSLVGVSDLDQVEENARAIERVQFSETETEQLNAALGTI